MRAVEQVTTKRSRLHAKRPEPAATPWLDEVAPVHERVTGQLCRLFSVLGVLAVLCCDGGRPLCVTDRRKRAGERQHTSGERPDGKRKPPHARHLRGRQRPRLRPARSTFITRPRLLKMS